MQTEVYASNSQREGPARPIFRGGTTTLKDENANVLFTAAVKEIRTILKQEKTVKVIAEWEVKTIIFLLLHFSAHTSTCTLMSVYSPLRQISVNVFYPSPPSPDVVYPIHTCTHERG